MNDKLFNRLVALAITVALYFELKGQGAPEWAVVGFCALALPIYIIFMNTKE